MANTLMFEVGIKRAEKDYKEIYNEVMNLVELGQKGINLKISFQKSDELKTFVNALNQIGDGKMLEPLLHKIEQLQISMVRLGMIPKDINYNALAEQLDKITVAYQKYQEAVAGKGEKSAVTQTFLHAWERQLEKLKNDFGMTEEMARAANDTFNNMGKTIVSNMERIGGSKAAMGTLADEVKGVKGQVDSLVTAMNEFVGQLKALSSGAGMKSVSKEVGTMDEKTVKVASDLAVKLQELYEKKKLTIQGEEMLATETRTATGAMMAEEDQAKRTALAMEKASQAITAAAMSATHLGSVMGGNKSNVEKFLELSSKMDTINKQAQTVMTSTNMPFAEKQAVMDGFAQELAKVSAEMDKLKSESAVGNPLIDAFTKAIEQLNAALSSSKNLLTGASNSVGNLSENMAKVIVNSSGVKNIEVAAKATEESSKASSDALVKQKGDIAALEAEIKQLVDGPLKQYMEIEAKLRTIAGNWRERPDALGIGSGSKQKHDILDVAIALNKVAEAKGKIYNLGANDTANTGRILTEKDAIEAIAKEYKITNEEAAKYLKLLTESELVARKFYASLQDGQLKMYEKYTQIGYSTPSAPKARERYYDQLQNKEYEANKEVVNKYWEAMRKLNQMRAESYEASQKTVQTNNQEAQSAEKAAQATQKLNQAEQKVAPQQGSILDPKQFSALQDAITEIIKQIKRLKEAFAGIGEIPGITKLSESVNGVYHNVETLKTTLLSLSNSVKFTGSTEEIAAYEAKVKSLQEMIAALEGKLKTVTEAANNAAAGIKTVASGKGSEATQNSNMDVLKTQMEKVTKALEIMEAEYKRMDAAGAQNAGLQERINKLREYYEWLQKVAQTDLSKAGALKANDVKFNDNLLFGQMNKQMYSDKAVKEFSKIVDETIKGKAAADSLNEAFERMKQQMLGVGSSADGGMRGVVTQMESINRVGEANIQTLIKEKGHIERLIEMAEKSVNVAKGNPVAGMFGLESQQRENLVYLKNVKDMIDHILTNRNAPEWMHFLNTPNSLRLPLAGSENDIALLGAHFNILTHNVTGTTSAIRNLKTEMRLDDSFATYKKWNTTNLERGLYNVNDAIKAIKDKWAEMSQYADTNMAKAVATQINKLNEIKASIERAMSNDELLKTRNGYASVLTPTTAHDLKESKDLVSQLNAVKREGEKIDKEYMKEVDKFTEQSKKAYAQAEKEKQQEGERTRKAEEAALEKRRREEESYIQWWTKVILDREKKQKTADERAAQAAEKAAEKRMQAEQKATQQEYAARQKASDAYRREAESLVAARQKMLQGQESTLYNILSRGQDKLGTEQYERVRNALIAVREELRKIETATQRGGLSANALINLGSGTNFSRLIADIQAVIRGNQNLAASEHDVAAAASKANSNLQGQSQILSDLKSMAMQYLSVWGAQSFINNIIELGGQLEQQRLSIGAILQDTAQANHLFGQIKDLAIKSPFGVQQLDAMTKQLSAYGFQYSELYEWTKRLADISAATGTSVDRLALALGHVRSEGALSGYTLRQFSMGNIPLLQKLSENLGKTKQEIRKMTRAKEIGYEDVLNVLKQLTDEGGMFYEAQETMAQALNAKFKNLRDSFQIMYSEMAEGAPGDFLKGVAEVLTDISKSWRVLMPVILSGAGVLGMWKLSTIALNHELQRTSAMLAGNAIATSKYSVAQLRAIATTGRWTLALRGLGSALMSIGKFIFNPVTLGFAAVEGLIYLWSKHNDEVRKAWDLTKAYGDTAIESEKNIAKQLEKIKPFSTALDDSALKTGIDSMTESIKNYAINGQSIINSMFDKDSEGKVMSLAEKYKFLRKELEDTIKVYKELKRVKDAFEYGINESDGGLLDDNVETDLTQYAEAYKAFVDSVTSYNAQYGNSIENAIKNAEKADPVFAKATENLTNYGEKLAEFWSAPEKYQKAAQFMDNLFGTGAGSQDALDLNESFFGYLNKKNEAMKELDQFIENTETRLRERGYDFSKELAPEQVGALLKMSKDWIEKHPEWENIYDTIKEKLEGRWPIKIVPDTDPVEEELPKWMEDFQKELDKTGITLTADMSMEQIIDLMKKAYDKAQTTINKLGPIALNAKVNISGLSDDDIEVYNNPLSEKYNPELYNTLKELKRATDTKGIVNKSAQKRGIKLEGMRKDGTHKAEKQNQENAKAVREQVRVIKEAADAFQYWRDKVGDKGAWEHVKAEFGDVLKKIGITAENIEDVRGHLKRIPQMKEFKAITDKKVKTETEKELAKEEDQFIRKDFERDTEKFLSQTKLQLENLTRAWDKFNTIREATGDTDLAVQISHVTYKDGDQTLADAVRQYITNQLLDLNVNPIPFDVNLDPEALKERVWEAFAANKPVRVENESEDDYKARLADYEKKIKAVVEMMKEWQKLQIDVEKSDLKVFTEAWNDEYDRKQQFNKVVKQYEDSKNSLDRLLQQWYSGAVNANGNRLGITQEMYDKALRNKTSEYNWGKFQAENNFKWVFDNISTTSLSTIRRMVQAMGDYAKNTEMSEKETRAWLEVMDKLTDQETILDPLQSIADTVKAYNVAVENRKRAEDALKIAKMSPYERAKRGINESSVKSQQQAEDDYNEALSQEEKALLRVTKAIEAFASKVNDLGSELSRLGNAIGGNFGDIMSGVGGMLGDLSNGINSASNLAKTLNTGGFSGTLGTVTSIVGILGSVVEFNQKLDSLLPSTESIYERYAERQRKINQLQEQIADYQMEALKRQMENTNWLYQNGLSELRTQGFVKQNLLKEYANTMLRPQEVYQEARSGFSKWGPAIVGAIVAVVGTALTWWTGAGAIGSAALGTTIATALGTTATAAVGYALAAGAGAAVGTALRSAADEILYQDGQTSARQNMRVQTQHRTFFRGEETQNLEDWVRENYKTELFDKDHYDLIDIELAKQILEDGPTLVGETRETLERMVEYAEQIREIEDGVKEYVSQMFAPLVDNMTDALWEWLATGRDILDSFEDYASDTFKNIAQDAVKSFLKIKLVDKYQEKLNDIYTAYSLGAPILDSNGNVVGQWNEESLGLAVASVAGQIKTDLEALSPALEMLGKTFQEAFDIQGYDIVNGSKETSASTGTSIKSVSEQTADLLASYLNAVRADVSVNRAMIAQYFPMYYTVLTSSNNSLGNIESNTAAIMRSNQIVADRIMSLDNNIIGLKNKAWKVPVA